MTTWDVVVALVRQLVEATTKPTIIRRVQDVFLGHEHKTTRPTLSELSKLLGELLHEFKERFISLDGLDEMRPEQQVELLDIILALDAKVLIMSRPLALLKARLEKRTHQKPGFLEVVANPADLDLFLVHVIDKNPALANLLEDHSIKQDVMEKIKAKADGM